MVTVIVVEPHALLRLGILQHLIDALSESTIQGTDYSSLSKQTPVATESDLVLLSVALCEDVIKLTHAAQHVYAPKQMLLLSDAATMPSSWQGLPSAVVGYISRNASPDVLTASIRLVLAGGKCFQSHSPAPRAGCPYPGLHLAPHGSDTTGTAPPDPKDENKAPADVIQEAGLSNSPVNAEAEMLRITPRQYEVLVLLARGYPMKTISRHLNISVATVKAHADMLYQRLGAHNRNQAVYTAISHGAKLGWVASGHSTPSQSVNAEPRTDVRHIG